MTGYAALVAYSGTMTGQPHQLNRHELRKATTRSRIAHAASQLFTERSYEDCSMADIAQAGGVATRTVYLHFDSKASILLAYFDDWLDAFVDALRARPADEPIDVSLQTALAELAAGEWADPPFSEMTTAHPTIEHVASGSLEVAGYMMQRWSVAQGILTDHYAASGLYPQGSRVPRARASLVFASFVGSLLIMRDAFDGKPTDPSTSGYSAAVALVRDMNRGSI